MPTDTEGMPPRVKKRRHTRRPRNRHLRAEARPCCGGEGMEMAGRWQGGGRHRQGADLGTIWIWTTWAIWSRAPSPFGAPARANRRTSTTGRHPPFSWSPLLGRGNNKRCCLLGWCCWDRATGSFHFPNASWSLFRPVSTRPAAGCSPLGRPVGCTRADLVHRAFVDADP